MAYLRTCKAATVLAGRRGGRRLSGALAATLLLAAACDTGSGGGEAAGDVEGGAPSATATRIDIWARLPGVTATVAGATTVLDATGGELLIDPGIRATSAVLRLEHAGEVVELDVDWSRDYEELGLAGDARLEALTLIVQVREGGACGVGMTNGLAGGSAWTSLQGPPIGACGPFGLRFFRLVLLGSNCEPGDSCSGLMELETDGRFRVDPFGGTTEVTEATITPEELAQAREVFGAGDLLELLASEMPCPSVTDSSAVMRVDVALESVSAQVAGCTLAPISDARDLAYELADRYGPAP